MIAFRLVFNEETKHWSVFSGNNVVTIEGSTTFADKQRILCLLEDRNLVVLEDFSIIRKEDLSEKAKKAEAYQRKLKQNRTYYKQRSDVKKAEDAARNKQWREAHPEAVKTYRKRANASRRARYSTDSEFRAQVKASNKKKQDNTD